MKGLLEILTEKKWMVSPTFVHGIKKALEQNLNTHAVFEKPERTCGFVKETLPDGAMIYPEEYQISEDGKLVRGNWALDEDDLQTFPFVSVLTVDGPITRNGGGCSYGSIDHRDMMIRAANHPLCRGHIFIINTPGGSAWAKNDYQQAIEYARSLGQPVIAFVDGMCASAGMYLASLCDERYYMHPKDEIGCIGVMAAFYTQADGSKNQFTDETYHELYDPESFDKNREFRDIANDGNTKALVKELAELGVEFRADVKAACPNAKDEHLHGKIFDAEKVKGILMDDQSDFFSCVHRCFDIYDGKAEPISREAPDEPEDEPSSDPAEDPNKASSRKQDNNNSKLNINMANYPLISAALCLKDGDLAVKEDGAFMNAPLLDTLEAHLNTTKQQVVDAQQKATQAEQSLADLQAKLDAANAQIAEAKNAQTVAEKALADANQAHAKAIENLNTEHSDALAKKEETIAKKDEEIKNLTSDKAKADEELKGAKDALATAEQTIADKDAQIKALGEDAGEAPDAGAAPENNGEGAKVQTLREFDPSPYKTNKERKEAFERYKRGEE